MNLLETKPYPVICKPVLKSKIWGGRRLARLFNLELPEDEKIGEAWMVADLPEGSSTIQNGPCAGQSLSLVTSTWGEEFTGAAWRGKPTRGRFPLLVKFLDAMDDLSVQVHPDQEACREHFPDDFSKDESWIVLDTTGDGSILYGFRPEATIEEFDRRLEDSSVEECLNRVDVSKGDFFRVAPGTVHALCKGVVILEIQEPSDSTFRIYDYGRLGQDGKPRPLHVEAARKVMRFDPPAPNMPVNSGVASWGTWEVLADAPAYRIERANLTGSMTHGVDPRSAQVVVVLDGEVSLKTEDHDLHLAAGSTCILPASQGEVKWEPESSEVSLVLATAGSIPILPTKEE